MGCAVMQCNAVPKEHHSPLEADLDSFRRKMGAWVRDFETPPKAVLLPLESPKRKPLSHPSEQAARKRDIGAKSKDRRYTRQRSSDHS
ncbi:hypothetical protein M8818_003039 [Zalaria obscura]|uniref:Uncharacterized protein n=1 Tax=Zalaria obscura TaxID=2024903 RepID=A0ACC3SGN8_9PEZI